MKNVLAQHVLSFRSESGPETSHKVYVVSNGTQPQATVWDSDGEGKFVMNFQPSDFDTAFQLLEEATGYSNLKDLPVYADPNIPESNSTSYAELLDRIGGFERLTRIADDYKYE